MEKLYQMGPVTLCFRDFPEDRKWPFPLWKLDPFSVPEGTAQIIVDVEAGPITVQAAPLWREKTLWARRELYTLDDGSMLWQQTAPADSSIQLQYRLSAKADRITLLWDSTNTFGMAAMESLTFFIFYALLAQGVLCFHSLLLEHQGKGLLIAAPSGVGKTTHGRLWRDHKNALILNGDRGCCWETDGRWMAFGTPWCGTSGEYLNRQVPVQALVILKQGPVNRVTALDEAALLEQLLPQVVYPYWNGALTQQMLMLLDGFLTKIPGLLLECTPDTRAVDVLSDYLEKL